MDIEKLKQKYLNNPDKCPICNSTNITGDHFEAGHSDSWRAVSCNDCGASWTEVFGLKNIENVTKGN